VLSLHCLVSGCVRLVNLLLEALVQVSQQLGSCGLRGGSGLFVEGR